MSTTPSTNNTTEAIQYLLEAIDLLWTEDELRPGLTLSYVESGCYAAIVRWPRRDVKRVALSTRANSLKGAASKLKALLQRFMAEGRHLRSETDSAASPGSSRSPPPGAWNDVRLL